MANLPAVNKEATIQTTDKAATRYNAPDLHVTARTIGTKISFAMPVANVSASGLLLGWKDQGRSPFAVNTILEMEISHPTNPDSPKVGCLGKVVRRFNAPSGQPSFGVKIIQSETDEQIAWKTIIAHLDATVATDISKD